MSMFDAETLRLAASVAAYERPSDCGCRDCVGVDLARAILGAWSGETFLLSAEPVLVRPIVSAWQAGSAS